MREIFIRDNNFFSEKYSERPNPYFKWVWERKPNIKHPITVFTDGYLPEVHSNPSEVKIGMLFEPPIISGGIYTYAIQNHSAFNYILTFNEDLLKVSDKFRYYPYGTTWVHPPQRGIHFKTKNISTIISNKKFAPGHIIRHESVKRYADKMDVFGREYCPIGDKIDGLRDYRFSFAIENSRLNSYFTEKLMDCFFSGTIPIYWGFDKAKDFFNPDGMILFNSLEELDGIIDSLNEEEYARRLPAVKDNFNRAHDYLSFEKSVWEVISKENR